ncbi:MAG: N-acetylmuramoyl-L-alanine amidase [Chitinophagaceae bacterium]|nr:N-acetylmuramoyl-L-alanine amidase [Chitinophagaceae bacterium]
MFVIILYAAFVLGAKAQTVKTIIIDPGHGYPTLNAHGQYSYESDLTLIYGQMLAKKIRDSFPGIKVLLTRDDRNDAGHIEDPSLANRYRGQFANNNHGDLFVSIHCNDAPPVHHSEVVGHRKETYYTGKKKKRKKHVRTVPIYRYWTTPSEVTGTETYIWAANTNDSKADFVKSRTDQDSSDLEGEKDSTSYFESTDTEAKIMATLRTKKYFDRSLILAQLVQDEFANQGRVDRGVKQRNNKRIWVLQATAMPAILVETGFITNPGEENYMNSERGKEEISGAIFNAVRQYILQVEKRS